MALSEQNLVELVVATLATYQYSLERAWALAEPLQDAGLCDPSRVAGRDPVDVGNALKAAGYDRGGITYIISPRIVSLMQAVTDGSLDDLTSHVEHRDRDAFGSTLLSVHGFGPKAVEMAWALMAAPADETADGRG
jgi:hypothetical protein